MILSNRLPILPKSVGVRLKHRIGNVASHQGNGALSFLAVGLKLRCLVEVLKECEGLSRCIKSRPYLVGCPTLVAQKQRLQAIGF